MLFKTVLGVVLLRTAWQYHDDVSDAKKNEPDDNKDSLHEGSEPDVHSVFQPTGHVARRPHHRSMKSKSLSDIERFTLCSNRII